jgi:hypothetical protein
MDGPGHREGVEIPDCQIRRDGLRAGPIARPLAPLPDLDPSPRLDDLLAEIDRDPTGAFWG